MTADTAHPVLNRRAAVTLGLGAVLGLRPRGAEAALISGPHNHSAHRATPSGTELTQRSQDPQDTAAAPLKSPGTAGRPRARVVAGDNDPFIIGIEHRLKCNCGCAHSLYVCRTTDFSCGFWQPLHAEVIAMAENSMTAEEIVDAYVDKYGELYLMAPVPEGFNLTGYFLPGVVLSMVAGVMVWYMKRRAAMTTAAVSTEGPVHSALDASDAARLEAELRNLDS